jgi:AcrR family transcriptional regulator
MSDNQRLRERKKRATRLALSWAALRLAVDKGLPNVRVEDIAAEAGVSTRTFNNYFSRKEEAIVAIGADRAEQAADAVRRRPPGEPLWTAVIHAMVEQFAGQDEVDHAWVSRVRLITKSPALRGEYLKSGDVIAASLAKAIAERTGMDAVHDLYPRLAADVIVSAEQAAIDYWIDCGQDTPLAAIVEDVLRQLASGLPVPSTTREETGA